jgi:hypothetical protein
MMKPVKRSFKLSNMLHLSHGYMNVLSTRHTQQSLAFLSQATNLERQVDIFAKIFSEQGMSGLADGIIHLV